MSLFCSVYASLPYNAILHKMLWLCVFVSLMLRDPHKIFLLVESFLCQCSATSYFTLASAVLGHRASKVAELCDWLLNSLPLTTILDFLRFLLGIRITLVFFTFRLFACCTGISLASVGEHPLCVEVHVGHLQIGSILPTHLQLYPLLVYLQALCLWHAGCRC